MLCSNAHVVLTRIIEIARARQALADVCAEGNEAAVAVLVEAEQADK